MKTKSKQCGFLNCQLSQGHQEPCEIQLSTTRTSPCASKCSHRWCDGYNAGYEDGQADESDEQMKRSHA